MSFFTRKPKLSARDARFASLRENIIGHDHVLDGPFGPRHLFYADYVASGRSYGPIEDVIRDRVLPLYANTHTEASATGRQSTAFRERARAVIASSIGATDKDAILFCGSGCTGAIDKFIQILGLKLSNGLQKYGVDTKILAKNRPVIFIGPYEHHSNDVQWRETIADVITIGETKDGLLDLDDLEKQLIKYKRRPLRLGSFSTASNVTGICTDADAVAKLLHKHGALAAFDYAGGAPYVPININAGDDGHFDAVFISPHKFLGGPGTPGLLVLKKELAQNKTPVIPGGGTVSYVSPCAQAYLECIEHREEGGTPDIVGAIRTGLVFDLKEKTGSDAISEAEHHFAKLALKRWDKHPNIQILGDTTVDRLPIFSLLIRHGKEQFLHYNFVVALLNDMFGIQARGGCSCAGPYGHRLLNIDIKTSKEYEAIISGGLEVLKPGWVRVGFNYFFSEYEAELLLHAIEWVADHGAKLLPLYQFESQSGKWVHLDCLDDQPLDLTNLPPKQQMSKAPHAIKDLMAAANAHMKAAPDHEIENCCPMLAACPDHLKWFVTKG